MIGSKDKQQVFYVHGGESFQQQGDFLNRLKTKGIWDLPDSQSSVRWTQTLADDLGGGYEVFMPQMPNKQNARYEEWKIWFERHFEYLKDDVILIGCSLGAMFLTRYLIEETPPFTIKALFIMASPVTMSGFDDTDCGDFSFDTNRVEELAKKTEKIIIMHSKDDFVVPYEHALQYKAQLPEAELVTFEDKNHFLIPKFPELLNKIRGIT